VGPLAVGLEDDPCNGDVDIGVGDRLGLGRPATYASAEGRRAMPIALELVEEVPIRMDGQQLIRAQ
jgi:hypothetical protein